MAFDGALAELIQYTEQWTDHTLSTLFDNVDNQLFDLAEKADNSTDQNTYFDAMRLIRLNRKTTHKAFLDFFSQQFLVETINTEKISEEIISDSEDLSLVADDSLEQDLATHGMRTKAERDNKKNLDPLNKRLTYLYNNTAHTDIEIKNDNNPIGPASLCHSFALASNNLDADIKIKLLIFKLFDINFITKLHELYEHSNQLLIKNNILPQIKVSYKGTIKTHTYSAPVVQTIPNNEPSEQVQPIEPIEQSEQVQQMQAIKAPDNHVDDTQAYVLIQQLITQNQSNNTITEKQCASKNELMESIAHLEIPKPSLDSLDTIPDGTTTSDLLKAALSQSLQANQKKTSINQEDENIIDVLGMLFNFILEDERFFDSVKALLSRLQIPIIKTALNDPHFFKEASHPARTLLNELANMGLGITDEINSKNNPLYSKLSEVVNIIVNEPVEHYNNEFYEGLHEDLKIFLTQFNDAPEINSKQSHSKILNLVNNELSSRISQKELPHNIILLLELIWRDVLFDVFITDGLSSDEWDMAITFVDTLIWSVTPKVDLTNQKKLVKVIPGLLKALNIGLDRINYSENLREQLLQDLQNCHIACMKGHNISDTQLSHNNIAYISHKSHYQGLSITQHTIDNDNITSKNAIEEEQSDFDTIEDNLLAAFEDNSEQAIIDHYDNNEDELIEDNYTQQARELNVGAWVEFLGTNGKVYRAKISWKSEESDAYIFVTQTGQIAEKLLVGLSNALRNKQATIIDESPIFEHAMDAVLDDLQSIH